MAGHVPYIGYFFGHVTIWACVQHEYPCVFCLQDDWQGILDDWQSTLVAWLCLHFTPTYGLFTFNHQDSQNEYLAHGFNGCLVFSQRKSISQLKTFRQATSIFGKLPLYSLIFIVTVLSWVDHEVVWSEYRFGWSPIYSRHVLGCESWFYHQSPSRAISMNFTQ